MRATIWFLLLFTAFVSAQVSGTLENENGQPIPYVNIWVEGENTGTTSDENGLFSLNTTEGKILVFSSVGYQTLRTKINNNQKIILSNALYQLGTVEIVRQKNERELEIGDAKKIHHRQLSGDKPWIYARKFDYEPQYVQTPFIRKIIFFSDSDIKDARLKIRVFDSNDSLPGADLLPEDLIVTVKKGMRKNEIDISRYKLQFPQNGVVIGLEWMIVPGNRADFTYKDTKSKEKVSMESYAPCLVINYSEKENSYRYSGGKWYRSKIVYDNSNSKGQPWHNKIMTPAINLILSN